MRRTRGTGSILNDRGRFRARLPDGDGKDIELGCYDSYDAAAAVLDAALARMRQSKLVAFAGVSLDEYGQVWLKDRLSQGRCDNSNLWKNYVTSDPIGARPIAALHPADIREWIDRTGRRNVKRGNGHRSLPNKKISRSTWQNALNMIRACLEEATQTGLIKQNPARGAELPQRQIDLKAKTEEPWTWLDIYEQSALLRHSKEPERWLIQFAIWTGLRLGEQSNLKLIDVHADGPNPHIVVRHGSEGGPTKGRRIRYIPMLPGALEAWENWCSHKTVRGDSMRARQVASGLAFPSFMADSARTRSCRVFDSVIKTQGIAGQTGHAVSWHSLRHTCASMLVSGTWGSAWTLEEVKGFLGHRSITTTERYAHLANSALARAADRIRSAMVAPTADVVSISKDRKRIG